MQLPIIVICALALNVATIIMAQDGPTPPRILIPGALPIPIRPQFRNEKLGPVRIRRPLLRPVNAIPAPIAPKIIEEAKPVTEEPEEENPESFIPQIISQQQQQHQQPQQSIFQEQNSIQQDAPIEEPPQVLLPRFQPQERPTPQRLSDIQQNIGAQRFSVNPDRPKNRGRPAQREPRPQFEPEQIITARQSAPRPNVQRPLQPAPINPIHGDVRIRRPVSQIVRKYQEENEDGSITWGYENDDGSFKEETIGIDCITRGRYGYIDPDGVKREYNYETGIPCDPNKRNQPEETEQSGFVDYEGNRAVLPNGVEIDLANMGKKKSKRPGAVLQQPQQFYRN